MKALSLLVEFVVGAMVVLAAVMAFVEVRGVL